MINEIKNMIKRDKEVKLECMDRDKYLNKDSEYISTRERILDSGLIVSGITPDDMGIFLKGTSYCIPIDELKYFKIKDKQEQVTPYSEKLINKDAKFQEMLAVASNAVDKGVLSCFTVNDMDYSDMIGNALYLGLNMTYHAIENEIKGINEMIDENRTVEQEVKEVGFDDVISAAVKAAIDGVLAIRQLDEECLSVISRDGKRAFEKWRSESNAKDIANFINFINSLYTEIFVIESEEDIKRIELGANVRLITGFDLICKTDADTGEINLFYGHLKGYCSMDIPFLKGATVTQQKGNK